LRDVSTAQNAQTTSAATVEFRHVTKRYGAGATATTAVDDLSFEVPAGKICVFVGPSGAGKTTTLKMVNRLVEPTSGEILIDGHDVMADDPTELRRRVGYVIQQVGLLPHLTIGENVATVPRLLGWPSSRISTGTDELLDLVGLPPATYRGRYPSQLSGGERQRVGVARALAADPPLMLMDEPFGAVDPIVRERLQNELLRLQHRLAKTILFVTHDIDEAIKMADLVLVLRQGGRLAQFGPPEDVLTHPASDFVARFVGVDRGLKRLSLTRVANLELLQPATCHPGDDATGARQATAASAFPYLLLVDHDDRPVGWINDREIPAGGPLTMDHAEPATPFLALQTTLKDALSLLLSADVLAGVVVDDHNRLLGVITLDQIAVFLREAAR
jgi:osmoprotectant transport system ATP-binding protein